MESKMETASASASASEEPEKPTKEEPEKPTKEEPEPELGEHLKGVPESILVRLASCVCERVYRVFLQRFLELEEVRMNSPMPKVQIDSLSTRSYLDHTVVPVMMDAMVAVSRLRYVHIR